MNDSVLVNQVYLIFNRPQFLVDSSDSNNIFNITPPKLHKFMLAQLISTKKL